MTHPISLLYVDDAAGCVETEVRSLDGDGFAVERVGDPSRVTDRLAETTFDCVLAGRCSTDGDELGIVEAVADAAPDVPVVLYARPTTDRFVQDAFAAGVADVVHVSPETDRTPLVAARVESAVEGAAGSVDADLYERSFEAARDGIGVLDADGTFLLVNPSFAERLGLEPADVEGTSFREDSVVSDHLVDQPPDLLEQYAEAFEGALADGRSEFRYEGGIELDGERSVISNRVTAVRRENGSIIFVIVSRDITDRKAQERELARKNERLEEFASVISHDLRNPLNVAQGYLAEARRERDSEDLDRVAAAHDRMLELIEDLLALAREGESVEDVERVSLPALCDQSWTQVETAGASLSVETNAEIRADPGRLKQLLENLFRNAVEHGEGDVTITVEASQDGFAVEDDGPGIPADEREQVFESGYSTGASGSGLGLSIVRRIAEAHDWSVAVCEGTDGGARFAFTGVDVLG